MKIILLSDWFGLKDLEKFQSELSELNSTPRVAIIHNALRYHWHQAYQERKVVSKLEALGCTCVSVDLLEPEWSGKIKNCNVVYVGGGDTRRLMNTLMAGRCGEHIFAHLASCDGIYIGVSAGAIICGSSISPSDWLGDSKRVRVVTMYGFSLLPGYATVLPHYSEKLAEEVAHQKASGFRYPIRKLRNGESLFLTSDGKPCRSD